MTSEINPFEQIPPWLPTTTVIQAGGGVFNPSQKDPNVGEQSTLGLRVSRPHNTEYLFFTTSHSFRYSPTFQWLYKTDSGVKVGPIGGTAILGVYRPGPDTKRGAIIIVDCELVRVNTKIPKNIAPGVLQGPKELPITIKGKNVAKEDMIVTSFGVMSGLTYGKVLPLPDWFKEEEKTYDKYVFFIQLCNEQGLVIEGEYSKPGDSGSMILDKDGYVLGMLIGDMAYGSKGNRIGVATRFSEIEVALGVKLNRNA